MLAAVVNAKNTFFYTYILTFSSWDQLNVIVFKTAKTSEGCFFKRKKDQTKQVREKEREKSKKREWEG